MNGMAQERTNRTQLLFDRMNTTARGPVPRAQEKVVIARSGNKCAYPGCVLELTVDPYNKEDQPKATGKVAHIAGASPNGPRYDPDMSTAERGSANNLIYLCGTHHDAIDAQLHHHTREFLTDAKQNHEQAVARAVRTGLGDVTYVELTVVCTVMAGDAAPLQPGGVDLAVPLQQKIEVNNLGTQSVQRITDGLSQAARVQEFIAFQSTTQPDFGSRLVARFKSDYYKARADGVDDPDALFDYMVQTAYDNSGPLDTTATRAAALAVVAYLFELCEIFERE